MGLFAKEIGTVFLKETSDAAEYIEKLEMLKKQAAGEVKVEKYGDRILAILNQISYS